MEERRDEKVDRGGGGRGRMRVHLCFLLQMAAMIGTGPGKNRQFDVAKGMW